MLGTHFPSLISEPSAITPILVRALKQGVFSWQRFWTDGEGTNWAGDAQRLIYAASGQIGLRVFG
jgi:hypothetical protein